MHCGSIMQKNLSLSNNSQNQIGGIKISKRFGSTTSIKSKHLHVFNLDFNVGSLFEHSFHNCNSLSNSSSWLSLYETDSGHFSLTRFSNFWNSCSSQSCKWIVSLGYLMWSFLSGSFEKLLLGINTKMKTRANIIKAGKLISGHLDRLPLPGLTGLQKFRIVLWCHCSLKADPFKSIWWTSLSHILLTFFSASESGISLF